MFCVSLATAKSLKRNNRSLWSGPVLLVKWMMTTNCVYLMLHTDYLVEKYWQVQCVIVGLSPIIVFCKTDPRQQYIGGLHIWPNYAGKSRARIASLWSRPGKSQV